MLPGGLSSRPFLTLERAIFILWLALFAFLFSRHVPWRDEWQPWLVSAHIDDWPMFFKVIRYERHPPLQYLLNKLLLLFISPTNNFAFRLLPSAFTVANVYLLLFRARLPRPLVYFIPFGVLFLREYGLIARCYPIGLFFILLAALAYRDGRRNIAYVCLAVSSGFHLLFTLFAGIFLFTEWKWRLRLSYLFACMVVGIFLLFQMAPNDSVFNAALRLETFTIVKRFIGYWLYGLSGLTDPLLPFQFNGNLWKSINWRSLLVGVPLLFFSARELWKLGWRAVAMVIPVLLLLSAYGLGDLRHVGYAFVVVLVWAILRPTSSRRFLTVLSMLMCIASLEWLAAWKPWQNPPAFDLSGAGELRAFLAAADANTIYVTDHEWLYLPVVAATGKDVYQISWNRWIAYPYFRASPRVNDLAQWCGRDLPGFRAAHPGPIVLVAAKAGEIPSACIGKKIFETTRPELVDERFALYQL